MEYSNRAAVTGEPRVPQRRKTQEQNPHSNTAVRECGENVDHLRKKGESFAGVAITVRGRWEERTLEIRT